MTNPSPDTSMKSVKLKIPVAPAFSYRGIADFKWLPVVVTGKTGVSDFVVKLPSGREHFIAKEDFEALEPMVAPMKNMVDQENASEDWERHTGNPSPDTTAPTSEEVVALERWDIRTGYVGRDEVVSMFPDPNGEFVPYGIAQAALAAMRAERDEARSNALKQNGRAETYLNAAVGWERRAEVAEAEVADLKTKLGMAREGLTEAEPIIGALYSLLKDADTRAATFATAKKVRTTLAAIGETK